MLALFIAIDLLVIVIREVIDPQRANQHFTGREVRRQGLHKKSAFDPSKQKKKIADAFPSRHQLKGQNSCFRTKNVVLFVWRAKAE